MFYILNMCRWDWNGGLNEEEESAMIKSDLNLREEGSSENIVLSLVLPDDIQAGQVPLFLIRSNITCLCYFRS